MSFETISLGLTLVIPTSGQQNWAANIKANAWEKISSHDHTGSGSGAKIGAGAITDNSIGKTQLAKNFAFTQVSSVLSGVNPTAAIDFDNGHIHKFDFDTASGTVDVTVANPVEGGRYTILFVYGSNTVAINYPANFLFPQGQEPILPTDDNAIHKIEMYYDGTNYYCDWNREYA